MQPCPQRLGGSRAWRLGPTTLGHRTGKGLVSAFTDVAPTVSRPREPPVLSGHQGLPQAAVAPLEGGGRRPAQGQPLCLAARSRAGGCVLQLQGWLQLCLCRRPAAGVLGLAAGAGGDGQ